MNEVITILYSSEIITFLVVIHISPFVIQVESQREKALSYLFPVMSLVLLVNALSLTASVYAMLKGSYLQGATPILLVLSVIDLGTQCHIGASFIRQVRDINKLQLRIVFE